MMRKSLIAALGLLGLVAATTMVGTTPASAGYSCGPWNGWCSWYGKGPGWGYYGAPRYWGGYGHRQWGGDRHRGYSKKYYKGGKKKHAHKRSGRRSYR